MPSDKIKMDGMEATKGHHLPEEHPVASHITICSSSSDETRTPDRVVKRGGHRRSQTIGVACQFEFEQLQKLKEVEVLHYELESKSKELEASKEEAQLAALFGQTLLQRNQEMGAEIESTSFELLCRVETAEQEVKVLESKLSTAYNQIRAMEIARAQAAEDAELMANEMERMSLKLRVAKADAAKACNDAEQILAAKQKVEEQLETVQKALAQLQATHTRLLSEYSARIQRINELEEIERLCQEQITQLQIENQSICMQNNVHKQNEKKVLSESEAMMLDLAVQSHSLRDAEITKAQLNETISTLNQELDDLKEALKAEQLRVSQLTGLNSQIQHDTPEITDSLRSPSRRSLRSGSLFFELSKQLKEELRQSQAAKEAIDTYDEQSHSTKTRQNHTLAIDNNDNNNNSSTAAPTPMLPPSNDSRDEEDILKEFFMLTAAAVKLAGGGLGNDTCNILNEDLYEEAMSLGLTFDQYHKWLERRLEGTLEIDPQW